MYSTELVRTLMEVGYLAIGFGRFADAETIFAGVQAARPESELPAIGRAVVRLNTGRPQDAVKLLSDEALRRNPDSDLAKSFLGLALKQNGENSRSQQLLQEVADRNANAEAVALAKSLLES